MYRQHCDAVSNSNLATYSNVEFHVYSYDIIYRMGCYIVLHGFRTLSLFPWCLSVDTSALSPFDGLLACRSRFLDNPDTRWVGSSVERHGRTPRETYYSTVNTQGFDAFHHGSESFVITSPTSGSLLTDPVLREPFWKPRIPGWFQVRRAAGALCGDLFLHDLGLLVTTPSTSTPIVVHCLLPASNYAVSQLPISFAWVWSRILCKSLLPWIRRVGGWADIRVPS